MKATVDSTSIHQALASVRPAVSSRRPFVELTVGDGLTVKADDMDLAVSAEVQTEGRSKAGMVVVPHAPLLNFMAKADSSHVELELTDDMLAVVDGSASLALASLTEVTLPLRPTASGAGATLDEEAWARVKGMVTYCATDTARAPFTGVNFSPEGAVATDTYQLAAITHDFGMNLVVPASLLAAVPSDAGMVTIRQAEHTVEVRCGHVTIQAAAITGEFPDWRRIVPKDKLASVTVNAGRLSRATDRAALLAAASPSSLGRHVRFYESEGSMVVESIPDTAKGDSRSMISEVLDAEIDGEWDYRFGLSTGPVAALYSILAKPDELTLNLHGAATPVTCQTDDVFVLLATIRGV